MRSVTLSVNAPLPLHIPDRQDGGQKYYKDIMKTFRKHLKIDSVGWEDFGQYWRFWRTAVKIGKDIFETHRIVCLWNRRDLSIATKIRVYRASVRSVLLYGCECWALRVEDGRKLEVFDHHCLRIILRVKFTDSVSNETVRARCDNIARITQAIHERRLRWFGHVLRRPPQELSVTALDPALLSHWRRRRGGQFKTWLDTVRQDMEVVLGPSVFGLRRWRREWVELSRSAAADRHVWRGTVRDIIEAG
ncbi:hypothetical protein SprV_0501928700 [Sparganum proliferum]